MRYYGFSLFGPFFECSRGGGLVLPCPMSFFFVTSFRLVGWFLIRRFAILPTPSFDLKQSAGRMEKTSFNLYCIVSCEETVSPPLPTSFFFPPRFFLYPPVHPVSRTLFWIFPNLPTSFRPPSRAVCGDGSFPPHAWHAYSQ